MTEHSRTPAGHFFQTGETACNAMDLFARIVGNSCRPRQLPDGARDVGMRSLEAVLSFNKSRFGEPTSWNPEIVEIRERHAKIVPQIADGSGI